ncbi:MAG: nucleotidyltransferase family protein [Promethearchaeota archaeon]
MILCAGYGKRLRPYTNIYQKTMLPVHGKPLLEFIIEGLIYAGFRDLIIVVGYQKEQIIRHFQDGTKWGLNIEYVTQKNLNGTGGAVLLCENLIQNQHFFLTWGDILVPHQVYRDVYELYKNESLDFIIVANYMKDPHKGAAIYYDGLYCVNIIEKPKKGKSKSNYNNCGIFILSTDIFEVLKSLNPSKRGEIELPQAINIGIKERNWNVRIFKMEKKQFRGDFGDKNIYKQLKSDSSWLNKI